MVSPLVKSADSVVPLQESDMASIVDSLVAPLSLKCAYCCDYRPKKDEVSENFRRLETVWNREEFTQAEKDEEETARGGSEKMESKNWLWSAQVGRSLWLHRAAAMYGASVTLIEKQACRQKNYDYGKGRCNVCNNCG